MNLSRLFAGHILWRSLYLLTSTMVTILMARYLQASATGWVFYFISWLSFFFLLASVSMDASLTYFVSTRKISAGSMLSFSLGWTIIVFFLSWLVSFVYFKNGNEFLSENGLVSASVFFITGNILITFLNALFYSKNEFITPNIVFVVFNVLLIAWLLTGIGGKELSFEGFSFLQIYFFLFFLQGLINLLLYLVLQKNNIVISWPSWDQVKLILSFSGIAFGANILFFVVTRIDYWFIDYFISDQASLGNYIQASRLVQLFQLFPGILAAAVFPIAASGYSEKMQMGILSLSRIIFLIYVFAVLFIILTGKWLFPLLFGESFSDMYEIFLWLIPGLFSLASLSLISAYFAAINKIVNNLIVSLAGVLFIVLGDWLFIPQYGIIGAAVVSSIGYVVCFAVALYLFHKQTGTNWIHFFFFRKQDLFFIKSITANLFHKRTENKEYE